MCDLYDLNNRMNINVFSLTMKDHESNCKIILYDDHRTILNVLYYAMFCKTFGNNIPTIISFDRHDDACPVIHKLEKIQAAKDACFSKLNYEMIWQFTEFDLNGNDDDWVRAGMELGLIKHFIGIGHCGSDATNIKDGFEEYTTHDGEKHNLFSNDHLCNILGRGALEDVMSQKGKAMRNAINYHNNLFDNEKTSSVVLDVDLDCFTFKFAESTYSLPHEVFYEHYVKNDHVNHFMKQLIRSVSLITICRESGCCGGIKEANKILEYLDYYWFDGSLRA